MLYGLAAGPDPRGMTCADIEKGYQKNQEMAKTRSKASHRKNAKNRVSELEPFYQSCLQTGMPVGGGDVDSQAVIDAVFGGVGGSPGNVTGKTDLIPPQLAAQIVGQRRQPSTVSSALGIVAMVAAVGGLLYVVMQASKKKGSPL